MSCSTDNEAFAESMATASTLFSVIRDETADTVGVTRAAYGEGESTAARLIAEAAAAANLEVSVDHAANLYATLPGKDTSKTAVLFGSHLDSVPQGGNYDGLAGILAGLAVVSSMRSSGVVPPQNISVMGIRSEENAWFGAQHVGSRAALGLVPSSTLDEARRFDTGSTLAEHMEAIGADVDKVRAGIAHFAPGDLGCYIELHIEQGPTLLDKGLPVGIVSGIRGNIRCSESRCIGAYGHSGALPRNDRRDAVIAMSNLVTDMDEVWATEEERGGDLVMTFGRFFTDAEAHSLTKIPGEVRFSFDARSHAPATLDAIETALHEIADSVARRRRVEFEWGRFTRAEPASMDAHLRERLRANCVALNAEPYEMPSSAGHDAGDFANAGVPSAMLFVRNDKGSHNPDEHMEFEDFQIGSRILLEFVESLLEDSAA